MGYAKNWLTVEEWQKYREALSEREYREKAERNQWRDDLIVRLMYKGGLRVSEALDLQYPYDFKIEEDKGFVHLQPEEETSKTEEELQPVSKDLVVEVRRFMQAYRQEEDSNFVFDISRFRVYDIINEIAEEAEIEKKLGTHTLRRSRAKHLYESGEMELKDVSEFLRHDSVSTTEEYLNFSKGKMAEHVDKIDEDHNL
jgi:integrase/recombinase XerD